MWWTARSRLEVFAEVRGSLGHVSLCEAIGPGCADLVVPTKPPRESFELGRDVRPSLVATLPLATPTIDFPAGDLTAHRPPSRQRRGGEGGLGLALLDVEVAALQLGRPSREAAEAGRGSTHVPSRRAPGSRTRPGRARRHREDDPFRKPGARGIITEWSILVVEAGLLEPIMGIREGAFRGAGRAGGDP